MGPTPTEVQALYRASVVRVLGHWTGKVELVQDMAPWNMFCRRKVTGFQPLV